MQRTSLKLAFCLAIMMSIIFLAPAQNKKKSSGKANKNTHAVETKAVKTPTNSQQDTAYQAAVEWAESKMKHMSLDEKVAQLMFVRVPLSMNKKQKKQFEKNFTHIKVGGVCFFKGTATAQIEQTRRYQHLSEIPLMVTIDGEWGLGMRLTDCYSFPRQMLMGALSSANDTLIAEMGEEIGKQCRKMGIHVNFAPVCDINNNPLNPVIGCRSFGENKVRVARKSDIYARAMQKQGIIAVGKHFPGHGDTEADSHLELPVINHSKKEVDSIDLFPFRRLVKGGIRGMMIAHLQVNAYDNRRNMPSSLSERIVNPLLRKGMGFDGLIFTDGIDMKAVANNYKDGEGAIRALKAGCDVILLPIDVEKTMDAVVKAAHEDEEFALIIEERCRRILREKYLCGLNDKSTFNLSVPNTSDKARCEAITRKMARLSVTLVRNVDGALPFDAKDQVVNIAVGNSDTALTALSPAMSDRIRNCGKVVISLYGNLSSSNNYGVTNEAITVINSIASMDNVVSVLVVYGSPYILEVVPSKKGPQPTAIVMAYQNLKAVRDVMPDLIYGKRQFEGILPVSTGGYHEGTSLKAVKKPKTTPYDAVAKAGMDVECFKKIDTIAMYGIEQKAYPGCQVLVAKDGKVVYNRCYGRQTYDINSPVIDTNTVFDLASLTKVSATNLAIMKLVDAGKISLDDRLSRYLPYLKHSNKNKITVRQALSHYARLKAYDSYWKNTGGGDVYRGSNPPRDYVAIGDNVYIKKSYRAKILDMIADSKLEKKAKYVYSDFGFILLGDLVEQVSGQSEDVFMEQFFYGPLKMKSTCFQPLSHKIAKSRIAPTEDDKTFRNQQLRGYVHDPNAAALGGVAGHAGLFSTANDLFKLYQMMLNGGSFEGKEYISQKTFNTFNSRHYAKEGNRRALGFDKPQISGRSSHVAPMASQQSFGHTGFTGTMVWVDPKYNIVYIFLSNRVYPSAQPNKLSSLNIRTDIQEQIYKSIGVK
ncbi:MAG: serine hydrolase [Bacteroidales bacterium]|nr:serine hydrolase [Bacteroidales bacterium]